MIHIVTHDNEYLYRYEMEQAYRLRHQVFVEEMGWTDLAKPDGREIDQFDDRHAVHMLYIEEGKVLGYQRMLPTTRPHLLSDVMPQLCEIDRPVGPHVWEWTRFCVVRGLRDRGRALSTIGTALLSGIVEWGLSSGISTIIIEMTPIWLLRLVQFHFRIMQLGLPRPIGGGTIAVAATFDGRTLERIREFIKGAQRAAVSQPVVPTAAGARLLEARKEILYTCNAVKVELQTIATPELLRIGILQSFSSRHVSKLVGSFRCTNSHVAIEVVDGSSEQLIELLAGQQLDAVLTILDGGASKFASRVLFKEPYVLAVPESHRFAQRESVTLADLSDEPFIVRTGWDRFKDASHALVSRGIKIRVVYKTAQIDRTLALVAAGVGLSFIPARLVTPAVKQVQVADMDFFRTYGLLWARGRENELKEFIKFAESHCWTD